MSRTRTRRRRVAGCAVIVSIGLASIGATETATPAARATDAASLVDPLTGSERGGVFPGATVPFGMVQYSPNTEAARGGGYRYSRPKTWGFATTHLSGPGCAAMGDVVSLPTTGPVTTVAARHQKASFSHATEEASPGYYASTLDPAGIRAELTATTRTGWARYTYPRTRQAHVIVDPGANFRGTHDATVRIVGDRTIEGSVSSWGYWHACPTHGENRYTVYFSMRFDRPFRSYGTGNGATLHRSRRGARGRDAGAYLTFDTRTDRRPVVSTVGISFIDVAGARRNLTAESGQGADFDAIHARARGAWNSLLGRVMVSNGRPTVTRTFYTALYHSLLHPSVFSDSDGRYTGFDDRVHRVSAGRAHYTAFSMWDTYRSAHQVIDLVAPEVVADMMASLLDDQRQGGWLPKWPYAHFYTNEMVGDPAANVIADAYLKGLMRPADVPRAYAALMRSATDIPDPALTPFEGRSGLEDYLNRGFTPYRRTEDHRYAGSVNMEYGVNDCALALMAQRLGHLADRRMLMRRAKRYRNTVDRTTRMVRPRVANGSWLTPFDPASHRGFKEGTATQYTWMAPQDVGGLAAALGGRPATRARLDQFFDYARVAADPTSANAAWHGLERFTPRNEDDLQAPYLFNYLGQPWKTQEMVRAALALFTNDPNGLPSSDDLGTLSGWYVLSALGLYPTTGGDDHYALTSPLFDWSVISPPSQFYAGGPIIIKAPGATTSRHIAGVTLDGTALTTSVVSHDALRRGAQIVHTLVAAPNHTWATGHDTPVSACSTDPRTADVRLQLRRDSGGTVRARVLNAGNALATGIRIGLRAPGATTAARISRTVARLGPGARATVVWRSRALAVGTLRADASWAGPDGRGAALRTFATTGP